MKTTSVKFTAILLFLSLLSLSFTDDTISYTKMNDLVLAGLKGNVRTVADTMYDGEKDINATAVKKGQFSLVTVTNYNERGMATIEYVYHDPSDSKPSYSIFLKKGDTLIKTLYEADSSLISITRNIPQGPCKYLIKRERYAYNELVSATKSICTLNAQYRKVKEDVWGPNDKTDTPSYQITFSYDTVYGIENSTHISHGEVSSRTETTIQRDKKGNPTIIVEIWSDEQPRLYKRGYTYY